MNSSNKDNRPNWDEYFMEITRLTAKRSSSDKLHVGCIIVKDNRIVSSGYNGHIAGKDHITITRDNHEISIIHAECNSIADAAKRGISIDGCKIYVTHKPCINCTLLIIASGIKTIVYDQDYKSDEVADKLLNIANVDVVKYS